MPRNGGGVFSLTSNYEATPGETILAEQHNDPLEDLEQDANTARPIVAGGTGAITAIAAHDNLSTKGADVASAATTDIGAATGSYIHITGTTGITALGTKTAGVVRKVVFDAALTLTHNGTSLILPSGANITTAAGDTAIFVSEGGGNWKCLVFQPASGLPIVGTGKGSAIASASTISIGSNGFYHVTGTTAITDIDFTVAGDGRWAILEFDGALTLTHHSTTLVIPGGANITTAAGDICMVVQDSGDNIHVAWYQKANIGPLGRRAPDIILKNVRATNTSGGAATGSWTRDTLGLNTEARDVNNECSLSSSLFTLTAGTWYARARMTLFATDAGQLLLFNTTDGQIVTVDGSAQGYPVGYAYSGGNYAHAVELVGTFTIAAGKALALQGRTATASGSGYGVIANPGSDITHQFIELTRIA